MKIRQFAPDISRPDRHSFLLIGIEDLVEVVRWCEDNLDSKWSHDGYYVLGHQETIFQLNGVADASLFKMRWC